MLYFSRLLNALGFVIVAALIIVQRDVDNELLISGWLGLGLAFSVAIIAAALNFRGAIAAALEGK